MRPSSTYSNIHLLKYIASTFLHTLIHIRYVQSDEQSIQPEQFSQISSTFFTACHRQIFYWAHLQGIPHPILVGPWSFQVVYRRPVLLKYWWITSFQSILLQTFFSQISVSSLLAGKGFIYGLSDNSCLASLNTQDRKLPLRHTSHSPVQV